MRHLGLLWVNQEKKGTQLQFPVIVRKEIADQFVEISEQAEEFPHGFTSGGHPVGCAIAIKAIDVILKEGLLENVKNISPYFIKKLNIFYVFNCFLYLMTLMCCVYAIK